MRIDLADAFEASVTLADRIKKNNKDYLDSLDVERNALKDAIVRLKKDNKSVLDGSNHHWKQLVSRIATNHNSIMGTFNTKLCALSLKMDKVSVKKISKKDLESIRSAVDELDAFTKSSLKREI